MKRQLLLTCVFLVTIASVSADIKVSPSSMFVPLAGGEIASAVVPPGKKPLNCKGGRVLIANDGVRPGDGPQAGIVTGIDLDGTGTVTTSTHHAPPNSTNFSYGSNDHNLVSLPNGDVIYQALAFSKAPAPGAEWFPYAFRGNFGPGARSVQLTWRSEDCGKNFKYVGQADPVVFSDGGQCANPQGAARNFFGQFIYDMGGTDGPRLDVDRKSGRLILTYGCEGRYQAGFEPKGCIPAAEQPPTPAKPQFLLSACPLNMMYVVTSDDRGDTWHRAAKIEWDARFWRAATTPTKNGLAISFASSLFLGKKSSSGYTFKQADAFLGAWDYDDTFPSSAINYGDLNPELISTGITGPAVIARVPGRPDLVLAAVSQTIDLPPPGGIGSTPHTHGYRVFLEGIDKAVEAEIAPVVPVGLSSDDVIMHLTAIDLGVGPVLLYWYDVSTSTKRATIRGRVIYSHDVVSPDFTISRQRGKDVNFRLRPPALPQAYFYGDFKMAEGFAGPVPASVTQARTYTFLPAWVQPDGTAHVARVDVSVGPLTQGHIHAEKLIQVQPIFVNRGIPPKTVSIPPKQMERLKRHEMERGRQMNVPMP